MRTAILLGAVVIAESINHDRVNANIDILSMILAIFIGIDVVEFILKCKTNK